jgi:hypothetical protein
MKDGRAVEHPGPPMALSRDAEELVRAAQAHAERLCELALAQTPPQYHSFIVLVEQRKKVGGSEANPIWAEIRLPYLTVDGRVRMAIDEHAEAGKQLHLETAFVMDPTTGQPLARATVRPELRGTAVAHARIFLNGGGANRSNPVETGETSAVGRALGFLGYGCLGTGVASADDVLRARRDWPGRPLGRARMDRTRPDVRTGDQDPSAGPVPPTGARRARRASQSGRWTCPWCLRPSSAPSTRSSIGRRRRALGAWP